MVYVILSCAMCTEYLAIMKSFNHDSMIWDVKKHTQYIHTPCIKPCVLAIMYYMQRGPDHHGLL